MIKYNNVKLLDLYIEKFKNGDEEYLNEILEYFDIPLRGMVKKYYIVGEDDDDIMQIARIGIYKGIQSYDREKALNPISFLKKCAESDIKDELKKMNRSKRKLWKIARSIEEPIMDEKDNPILISDIIPSQFSIDEIIGKKELKKYIEENIYTMLSEFELQVLKLYINEYSYSEISKILSEPVKKIDNAMQRARKKIKENKELKKNILEI